MALKNIQKVSLSALKDKIIKLITGNTLNAILSALFGVYIARVLDPELRGGLALLQTTAIIGASITSLGISHAASFFIRNKPETAKDIMKITFYLGIFTVPVFFCVIMVSQDILANFVWGKHKLSLFFLCWMSMYASLTLIISTFGACIIAKGDSSKYAKAMLSGILTSMLASVFLGFFYADHIYSILIAYFVGHLVTLVMMTRQCLTYVTKTQSITPMFSILKFGLKSFLGSISSLVFKKVDYYIVASVLSASAVGYYAIALSLREIALVLSRSVAGIVGGEVASKDTTIKQKDYLVRRSLLLLMPVVTVAAIVSYFTFPYLVPLAFGENYLPATLPSIVLVVSAIFFSGNILVSSAVVAIGEPLAQSFVNVFVAIFGVALLFAGAKTYGLNGIVWANVIICAIGFISQFFLFKLLISRQPRDVK